MRVSTTKTKDGERVRTFSYKSKSLEDEVAKCQKELDDKSKYKEYHEWKFDCAKKEYEKFMKRYGELQDFIRLAKTQWIPERDAKLAAEREVEIANATKSVDANEENK